jgi:uncharacterized protein YdcH (DUF465 family)
MRLHHPLLVEFHEYREVIERLKAESSCFRQIADEYHAIDRKVCRIERAFEVATDEETEALKKKRVWLKDLLYTEIRRTAAVSAAQAA